MKILSTKALAIPDIQVIQFARFTDERGYFTEPYRKSDFQEQFQPLNFVQANESFSRKNTIRGLHFQWDPYMGKLVRTIQGRMVDLALDIRKGSPTYGKIIAYDMPAKPSSESGCWIWIPPGFAHGNYFTEETTIEYFCTGEYSPQCEAGISPLADDLDWSLCPPNLAEEFAALKRTATISEKDRGAFTLAQWSADPRSANFHYLGGALV